MSKKTYYEVYIPSDQATFSDGSVKCTEKGLQKCKDKVKELRTPLGNEYDDYWAKIEIKIRKVTVTKKDVE